MLAAFVLQSCVGTIRTVSGTSDDAEAPVLVVAALSPTLAGGSVVNLSWTASDGDSGLGPNSIDLEYSVDQGATWIPIATGVANSSSYPWTVPSINVAEVEIRVTATDAAGNRKRVSSNSFAVQTSGGVTVSGGTYAGPYRGGASLNLTWTAADSGPGFGATPISLDYSTDSGSTWSPIATAIANTSPYAWTLPAVNSSQVRVRVRATNTAGHVNQAISAAFTIDSAGPSLTLTAPAFMSVVPGGSAYNVQWTTSDALTALANAKLEYSTNGGTSWNLISATVPNIGTYSWTPPVWNILAKLRLTSADAAGNTTEVSRDFMMGATEFSTQLVQAASTNFGPVTVGRYSLPAEISFVNSGAVGSGACSAPALAGTNPGDFEIVSDGCGTTTLAANTSCSIRVRAAPTTTGTRSATVQRTCGSSTLTYSSLSAEGRGSAVTINRLVGHVSPTFCVSESDGYIRCWGDNNYGQQAIAGGSNGYGLRTSSITGSTHFDVGLSHICHVKADSTVQCAGYNYSGQLGNGTTTSSATAVTVSGISTATRVAAGANHTCALLSDQTAVCWGQNTSGQLGNGTTTPATTPVPVSGLTGAIDIAAGYDHTCALLSDQTVRCWGANNLNQIGDGTLTQRNSPVAVSGLSGVTALALGGSASCALLSDSTIKCWGSGAEGQIGDGSLGTRSTPSTVTGITNATQVSGGYAHFCARLSDSTIKCWGKGLSGRLGNGSQSDASTPVTVTGITTATSVAAGYFGTCAVLSGNTIQCWGGNLYGGLGQGYFPSVYKPVQLNGMSGAAEVVPGGDFGCVLLTDQTVKCWGSNGSYRLGDGTQDDSILPVTVPGVTGAVKLAPGGSHTCALLNDQTVKCWGNNGGSQLGDGTSTTRTTAVAVVGLSGVVQLAASYNTTCARLTDQTVRCWGQNNAGQVGDGSTTNRSTPVAVSGLSGVASIAAGNDHFCAVLSDSTVRCWGTGTTGQLGNGASVSSSVPVVVSGLTGVQSLSLGNSYSCALLTDGTAKCWGRNATMALGDGTNTDRNTPVAVQLLTSAVSLHASIVSVCAVKADKSVHCWGSRAHFPSGFSASYIGYPIPIMDNWLVDDLRTTGNGAQIYLKKPDGTFWGFGSDTYNHASTDNTGYKRHSTTPVAVNGY